MTVRVRIAPSPTGDPHVGTAYVALFNVALARQRGGKFVLRIEDTDRGRYVENSDEQIFDTLRWLGLDWDEGPDKGGPYGPYRQSERLPLYRKYAEQRAALPGFDDQPVIRMRVPEDPPITFIDLIRGPTNAPVPDDQVILKKDGYPTYHLAVVVDDHEMGITHVLRAEEWISSMPKQLLLYRFFGWSAPKFAHLPLLRNRDRSKISKRKNPAARLLWFQEEGFLPEALLNFLALQGWSMPDGREFFSFDELVANFDVERFSTVGPIFDVEKLDWMNGQYIQRLDDDEFLRRIEPFLPSAGQGEALHIMAPHLKERLKRLCQVREQLEFLYTDELDLDADVLTRQGSSSGPSAP